MNKLSLKLFAAFWLIILILIVVCTKNSTSAQTQDYINKPYAVLSPDGMKIAFFEDLKLTVADNKGRIRELALNDFPFTSVNYIEWIDSSSELIGVCVHVNPSLEEYIIINSAKSEVSNDYYGIYFKWDKNFENLYYLLPPPHFSRGEGIYKIYRNDVVIYEETDDSQDFEIIDKLIKIIYKAVS